MCGIIGYSGHRPAIPVIMDGLRRLEYRGYDSAGVAYVQNKQLDTIRAQGKLDQLAARIETCDVVHATTGLGHTRWATHGLPTEHNAHPHRDMESRLALVHNGIIENYYGLKHELQAEGVEFSSETDTEVLVHLISRYVDQGQSVPQAIKSTLNRVEGSYALAVINVQAPEEIWAARHSSPLILGLGTGENFVASDIPAFLPYTREVVFLEDGELVQVTPRSWKVFDLSTMQEVQKEAQHISWDVQAAQKTGYKHFMLKEIMEQPQVIRDCAAGRIDSEQGQVILSEIQDLPVPEVLHIVACGTSYHAGLWAKYLLEKWAQIPVQIDIASEFRYRSPIIRKNDLVLTISQSGETADTLAGLRIAVQQGVKVLGLCNVLGSSVARESDAVIYTQAGPEISVASTKAMCSQMVALFLMALYWGQKRAILGREEVRQAVTGLSDLPQIMQTALPGMQERAAKLVQEFSRARSFFYLGRGMYMPLALEGALKLKEISYIHAEGYAAGEMKHGPIALIDPEFPTFALAPADELLPKLQANLQEVQARGGPIVALTHPGAALGLETTWEVPQVMGALNSFLFLPALQLFAYQMAVYLGKDVDQPRNLAKSVTVE
ncbi:MAG: glutamine--fructose-6-phosphate transaminase (isomerizing) [Thermodesulfobacteriota bacterium]